MLIQGAQCSHDFESVVDIFCCIRSGRQVLFHVQSGNEISQFRKFHRVQAVIKFIKTPARVDMFGYLEPVRQTHLLLLRAPDNGIST